MTDPNAVENTDIEEGVEEVPSQTADPGSVYDATSQTAPANTETTEATE